MSKILSFILLCWLVPIGTCFSTIITTDYTNTNLNTWTVGYSIENNDIYTIDEISIFFDYLKYENISIISSPANWDSIIYQPDPSYPDDGLMDSLALVDGINPGEILNGFSLSFDWIGSNLDEMTQYWEIIDPNTFSTIDSGNTVNAVISQVPEPQMILLFIIGLALMPIMRSKKAKAILILGAASVTAQSQAATIETIHATDYKLIKKERVGRTTFNFTYEVAFKNRGENYTNVIASAYSDNRHMKFADKEIAIPTFYQNSTNANKDTITITIDRRRTVSLDALLWAFTADVNETDSTLIAGQFIDEAVEGLYYTSESSSGYTDYNGVFQCKENESVAFYAGNIKLGNATCESLVTPISLIGSDLTGAGSLNNIITDLDLSGLSEETIDLSNYGELSDKRVTEILRLLHTVNEDPKSGRILIGKGSLVHNLPELDLSQYQADGSLAFSIDDLDLPEIKKPLISAEEAALNFLVTLSIEKAIKRNLSTIKDNFTHNLNVDLSEKRTAATEEEVTYLADNYLDQAYLSEKIYSDYEDDLYTTENGWMLVDYSCLINGFKAGLYKKDDKYNIVIAGTSGSCGDNFIAEKHAIGVDIYTDLHLLTNLQPDYKNEIASWSLEEPVDIKITTPQALTALHFLLRDKVKNALENGKVDRITGHSLGGGIAGYLGLYTGINTITFNPAPIPFTNASHDLFNEKNLFSGAGYNDLYLPKDFVNSTKIINIISLGDPVSYLSEGLLDIQELAVSDIDNYNNWQDTYYAVKDKLNMQNTLLGLDHVIQGETFYLPIQLKNFALDHSIVTINTLLSESITPPSKDYSSSGRVTYSYGSPLYFNNEADYYSESNGRFNIPTYKMGGSPYTSTRSEFVVFSGKAINVKGTSATFLINGPGRTSANPNRFFALEMFEVDPDFSGDASDCRYTYTCSITGTKFSVGLMTDYVRNGGDSIYNFNERTKLPTFSNIQGTHFLNIQFEDTHANVYYDGVLLSTQFFELDNDAVFSGFSFQITGSGYITPVIKNKISDEYLTIRPASN
jgi:predicted esterase YcpF (UPF0227 family)